MLSVASFTEGSLVYGTSDPYDLTLSSDLSSEVVWSFVR